MVAGALILDQAVFHDDDLVRHIGGDAEVVGHDDDAGAVFVAQLHHLAHDLRLGRDVQRAGGLVGQKQMRLIGHAHGDADALALAAGKLEGIGVHDAVRIRKAHPAKHLLAFVPGLLLGDVFMCQDILHIALPDEARLVHHRARVLEDHGDVVAAQRAPLLVVQGQKTAALVDDVARGYLAAAGQQAQHGADDRGLAGAALADDGADLAFFQRDAAVLDRNAFAVGDIDVFDFKQSH